MFLMHVYLNYVNVVLNKKANVDFQVFGLNICFIYDYVLCHIHICSCIFLQTQDFSGT